MKINGPTFYIVLISNVHTQNLTSTIQPLIRGVTPELLDSAQRVMPYTGAIASSNLSTITKTNTSASTTVQRQT